MWQNCVKKSPKIWHKSIKIKNVFKIWQNSLQKCDKNLTKLLLLTHFCHTFVGKMKHFEETFWYKMYQKCDKTYFLIHFWHIFGLFRKHLWNIVNQKIDKNLSKTYFLTVFCHFFVFKGQSLKSKARPENQRPLVVDKMYQKSDKTRNFVTFLSHFHWSIQRDNLKTIVRSE